MPDQETIERQLKLLAIYRSTLQYLLKQAAEYGGVIYAPAETANNISSMRANIRHTKETLHTWGVAVEDHPDDGDYPAATTSTEEIPQMDDEERQHLNELLDIYRANLREHEIQEAKYGIDAPAHLRVEIEQLRKRIRELEAQLAAAVYVQSQQPPPPDPPRQHSRDSSRNKQHNQIFISYSHADKRWMDKLMTHLKPLVRNNNLTVWNDTMIGTGSDWREEIAKALQTTKIALLLVSADFLASDFIAHNELPPLLKAAEEEGAIIMSVIIGHCRFNRFPELARFQAANPPSQPLNGMPKHRYEAVLLKLTEAVEKAL